MTHRIRKQWFVLRTHAEQERRAERELKNQDIKTFLPLARRVSFDRHGNKHVHIFPLFTRYLFAHLNWDLQRKKVMSTKGVKNFVGYYNTTDPDIRAPHIRHSVIVELKSRLEEVHGRMVVNLSRPVIIEEGDLIEVLFGPWKGQTSKVYSVEDNKIEILVSLFGKTFPKTIQRESVTLLAA